MKECPHSRASCRTPEAARTAESSAHAPGPRSFVLTVRSSLMDRCTAQASRVASHWLAMIATAIVTAGALAGWPAPAGAQDLNVTLPVAALEQMLQSEPLHIVSAQISRPKAKGDITLKAEVAFGERPPMRVKLRKAEPGAESFNNVPRYDLAAYELQKLLMDAAEHVVPPTALRMVPLAELQVYSRAVQRTFKGSDEVLCVLQYWLQEVKAVADVLDPIQFETDAVYARHIGQLNVFTYLIRHGDSNLGNFLISGAETGPRVFSIDNGVAFASRASDRGKLWQEMRIKRLPADTVERLRKLSQAGLESRLGVLAQWELHGDRFVPVTPGSNLSPKRGVRREENTVQMGLTQSEIASVWQRTKRLLKMLDDGDIAESLLQVSCACGYPRRFASRG